ncbi:MAG: Flp family type IVb pilin [Acidimicrobiales bacterium]|jgi:pilus assembly protein Flp/PilA
MKNVVALQNALAALKDTERGATAVEYGLIVALIAGVIVAIVTTVGTGVNDAFGDANTALNPPAV